ncbi:hypothetical protein K9B33_20905 [Sphingobium sp. 3R8]|uniref:hypothetical protein n=1 Tax=Sphingobium sp. 3R8 TaxID=2874921 RepID=UPI001CCE85E2|nr:hypothetical protein [Sphingobium sp. 3R8]MBZ9649998.1 hypothetical protein [Sphingobium sp. 3R8]
MRAALDGYGERIKRDYEYRVEQAHHTARWASFTKTLEPLAKVLAPIPPSEEQAADRDWHAMKVWAIAAGATVSEG